jgi:RNAse (barnase) inhibitor barstar
MKVISLHASGWRSPGDFYSALLPELGAPAWHGRNLNALQDSLYGGINSVEPPLRVEVEGAESLPPDLRDFLSQVSSVFAEVASEAQVDIEFRVV